MKASDRPLSMYTVYDHPKDYPNGYVLRRFEITPAGAHPTTDAEYADTLVDIRSKVPHGLTPLPRMDNDDPVIIETWF